MKTPYVSSHSEIDGNGQEYIGVVLIEPEINERDLHQGGKELIFEVNHQKQKTECWLEHWNNGAPVYEKTVKVWKGEVLVEQECLQFAENQITKQQI